MSASGRGAGTAQRLGSGSVRVLRFWRGLPPERRLAAFAAVGLFMTLFLPWYQETVIATGVHSLRSYGEGLSGWAAFSFVEAAVLLVAAGVLVLLFVRAEGGAFHVPGGDGGVITAAGLWTCALIVWRIFDKEGTTGHGQLATTWGIEWGIFIALAVGALLAYAGTRIRHAHEPEPPLPGERAPRVPVSRQRPGGRARPARGPEMEIDDTWTERAPGTGSSAAGEPPAAGKPRAAAGKPPAAAELPGAAAGEPPAAGKPPAAGEPPRRVRPRSIGAPARSRSPERPGGTSAPSSPPVTDPTVVRTPDAPPADRPRRSRGLDRREIQELDIAEPPTARLGRSSPRPRPRPPADDPEDQLTIRLDRPD